MALTRTLLQLRDEVRQRADMVNSAFVTNAEINRCINESWAHMYDQLLATGEDYYLKYVDIAATAGGYFDFAGYTSSTNTAASDVYQVRGVDAIYSDSVIVNVPRFNWEERNVYAAAAPIIPFCPIVAYRVIQNPVTGNDCIHLIPDNQSNGVQTIRVWYYPNPKVLVSDSDTIDGRSGWEEWVVVDAAIKLLVKEESDTSALERQAARIWARVMTVAQNRDAGQSKRVTDVNLNSGGWSNGYGLVRRF